MKKLFLRVSVVLVLFVLTSCEKEYVDPIDEDNTSAIKFISLEASSYSVKVFDTVYIKAVVEGENLTYEWQKNSGTLKGSGNEVIYWGCYSCIGVNTITCKASNDSGHVSKSINIEVKTRY